MRTAMLLALAGGLILPHLGAAQSYPARPVRLVVGYSAGGATDIAARAIAQKLSSQIGQQVIVENRPGAGSTLAMEFVARSAPDGYTLLFSNATIAMPSLFKKLAFDMRKDFMPVSLVGYGQVVLVVHPSLPVKSVKELVALSKRRPGEINYGSAGVGSFTHLAMALFESLSGAKIVHVPYKGSSQASIGVLTGDAQMLFSSPAAVLVQVRAGRLRPLGASGTRRTPVMPDVPTIAEAGVPGYDATSWYGMLMPSAAPKAAIKLLSDESVKALAASDIQTRLTKLGIEPAKGGVDEFGPHFAAELAKWAKVIKAAGIPPQ